MGPHSHARLAEGSDGVAELPTCSQVGQAEAIAEEVEQLKRLARKGGTPLQLTHIASAISQKIAAVPTPLRPTPKVSPTGGLGQVGQEGLRTGKKLLKSCSV